MPPVDAPPLHAPQMATAVAPVSRVIAKEKWLEFERLLDAGSSVSAATKKIGISENAGYRYVNGQASSGERVRKLIAADRAPGPKTHKQLSEEARHCLECFPCFRLRYMGHPSTPWQKLAALKMVALMATPHKEFVVVNCPPSAGKSTLMTDFICWILVRNRSTRVMYGSRTQRQATKYTGRIRRALERTTPARADDDGAVDAESTPSREYGRFKPMNNELWRMEEFVIAQPGDVLVEDKEASVAAYGFDSGYLGGRFDVVIWDDLSDAKNLRTAEARDRLKQDYRDMAETRLEPRGALFLVGQRLSADDIYRYALDIPAIDPTDFDDDDADDTDGSGLADLDVREADDGQVIPRKYHHIIYPAHDESKCAPGSHKLKAPAWPEGCLLDPVRLPWRELAPMIKHDRGHFLTVYQQEDTNPAQALVNPMWISGGRDPLTGEHYFGCKDPERGLWEIPAGLSGRTFGYITADPSPSKYWSVQAWVYHIDSEQRFLVDHRRQEMTAPAFLEYNLDTHQHTGLLVDWQRNFRKMGVNLTHVIVEQNAAQKFLLQYQFVRRWASDHEVQIIGHNTTSNKTDATYGVQATLPTIYHFGKVRLPYSGREAQHASLKIIQEVTRWPQVGTEDCVMSQWFGEFNIPRLFHKTAKVYQFDRPGYLVRKAQRGISA